MRVDDPYPVDATPEGPQPGYFPDPPNEDAANRSMTSSGITVSGGMPVGSASDRKQPDPWARRHGSNANLGPGTVDIEREDDE